jgi:transposase
MRTLGRRIAGLTTEITALDIDLAALVTTTAPTLTSLLGVGTDPAGQLLVTAGDNPHRLHSEAALARLLGIAPIPASSGTPTTASTAAGTGPETAPTTTSPWSDSATTSAPNASPPNAPPKARPNP